MSNISSRLPFGHTGHIQFGVKPAKITKTEDATPPKASATPASAPISAPEAPPANRPPALPPGTMSMSSRMALHTLLSVQMNQQRH